MLAVHPRGRGERDHGRSRMTAGKRFIPAGAGNARSKASKTAPDERFIPAGAGNATSGCHRNFRAPSRFIPAGAGNAANEALQSPVKFPGSSPRARGTRDLVVEI